MPYTSLCDSGIMCRCCLQLMKNLGPKVWDWSCLPSYVYGVASIATDGEFLWGVSTKGRAFVCQDGWWNDLGAGVEQVAVSRDGHLWGINSSGHVLHRDLSQDSADGHTWNVSGECRTLTTFPVIRYITAAGTGNIL